MLKRIGIEVHRTSPHKIPVFHFTHNEIEILAEMEHNRWAKERYLDGWQYGKEKDVLKKISPHLVSWPGLPESIKEYDRNTVRKIPELLANVGFELQRKKIKRDSKRINRKTRKK